jgi:hypothetical protein
LNNVRLDLEIGKLVAEPLGFDPKRFPFLLSIPDLLFQQDPSSDGNIVFGLQILQRRRGVSGLPFVIVIYNLDVSQLQLEESVRLPHIKHVPGFSGSRSPFLGLAGSIGVCMLGAFMTEQARCYYYVVSQKLWKNICSGILHFEFFNKKLKIPT